jgi:tetratricopeptide (TPR) repeat protein
MAFALGTVPGFLMSSYEGESGSVGKIRDWLIGGITGLTVAEFVNQGNFVKGCMLVLVPDRFEERDISTHYAMFIVYSVGGFFTLFLNRELVLNKMLERSRRELKGIQQVAGQVEATLKEVEASRPLDEPGKVPPPVAPMEKRDLAMFATIAEEAIESGASLDRETSWRLARSYFAQGMYSRALPLLEKAMDDPEYRQQAALVLAQIHGEQTDYGKAAAVLERLTREGRPPDVVYKLLGYYLLWLPGRLRDAVRYTTTYLTSSPEDSGAVFNLACAHAQLFGRHGSAEDRLKALESLRSAISMDSGWRARARELSAPGEDFELLSKTEEFRAILEAPP